MTQEDKQLLIKDLAARLPYGVKVQGVFEPHILTSEQWQCLNDIEAETLKTLPYLRSLYDTTDEEDSKLEETLCHAQFTLESYDYLNSIHVDYRGLIGKGLALKAPEGMYNMEKQQ